VKLQEGSEDVQKINDLELGSSLTMTDRARSSSTDFVCINLLSWA
jgi:hypothetical protein